ncbi:PREDICTED: uncharacterized protein C15orf26 homolog [Priapulus caudatus]|uniref:Uncharacterized protein C15orf26 homolog n=1 Tax=Priapulus caudatus TaxID=37621 RepID=A0ABM1DR06_PRICU|nr:PREDICTED: uncharacterized protein C15orf26 homolog [Priapulus caudatus]
MSRHKYKPSVRVGNWNEELCLEEDKLKDFLLKKENGELLIQKIHSLKSNILSKVNLSVCTDGLVHYGDTVVLVNNPTNRECKPVCLAANIDESSASNNSVRSPCRVSGAVFKESCARNALTVAAVGGKSNVGEPLRYGEHFMLCTTPACGANLKLFSEPATFTRCAKHSRHQMVTLVDEESSFTRWKVLSFDPMWRLETEGKPVKAGENVIITHVQTNQNLAMEENGKLMTMFGLECEISSHNYLDCHKAELSQNHWLFLTG